MLSGCNPIKSSGAISEIIFLKNFRPLGLNDYSQRKSQHLRTFASRLLSLLRVCTFQRLQVSGLSLFVNLRNSPATLPITRPQYHLRWTPHTKVDLPQVAKCHPEEIHQKRRGHS